ncbi:hypothetical protein ACHFJ0_21815 [Paracoccus sp. NGMCC 1.201697]|uniref:Stability/partitioning determinant n=1 Tax=Paracoccus broussonetiae subsp. drimophilus TaxID=3373869 RepID=A0ABW7LVR9_9RHOB
MTGARAKIGFSDALDLSDFTPAAPAKPVSGPEVAAAAGFNRREPTPAIKPVVPPVKQQRRRRTGRNAQINIKAKPETLERFYAAADGMGYGVGEAFELAVDLIEAEMRKRGR